MTEKIDEKMTEKEKENDLFHYNLCERWLMESIYDKNPEIMKQKLIRRRIDDLDFSCKIFEQYFYEQNKENGKKDYKECLGLLNAYKKTYNKNILVELLLVIKKYKPNSEGLYNCITYSTKIINDIMNV